ncbi:MULTISPECIES: hypothetical protein [unclassified Saccharothrix]|uniref:hypothetical protein n=1 Tax=unclassified Saccharothrix TaxID=2593673 RepID=UPI00307D5435
MSEYQYYEFLAIDRPLDDAQQAAVRSLSTRATITATSFVNEYEWGDFKGDVHELVERYYDAHLYVADWGTHRVMFRLPSTLLDLEVVDDYCVEDQVSAWTADEFVVLEFVNEDEPGDFDYEPDTLLSEIVGVRAELAAGDLRPLYLAWLAAYGVWERDEDAFDREADDDVEPPVPPGLGTLTAPQRALARFLRLDDDLLAVAARTSPQLDSTAHDLADVTAWALRLPVAEKDRIVERVLRGEAARVRMDLLHRFRDNTTPTPAARTVGELLDDAARFRADRQS